MISTTQTEEQKSEPLERFREECQIQLENSKQGVHKLSNLVGKNNGTMVWNRDVELIGLELNTFYHQLALHLKNYVNAYPALANEIRAVIDKGEYSALYREFIWPIIQFSFYNVPSTGLESKLMIWKAKFGTQGEK